MNLAHAFPVSYFEPTAKEIVVRKEAKKLWAMLLDMLLSFDEVCTKNGIKYFLDGGTLLGAVRHKGFIPWDDDLDVIMLREEYDKLCRIAGDAFKSPLFFQTEYTDRGSARGHAQLRRSDTTEILRTEMMAGKPTYTFNQGVFLDVFILDAVPDDPAELAAFRSLIVADKNRIHRVRRCLYDRSIRKFDISYPGTIMLHLLGKWYRFKKWLFGVDELLKVYRQFEADVAKYNGQRTRRIANFSLDPRRKNCTIFDRAVYEKSAPYEFEGHQFPGPADYETILRGLYGNWHEHVVGESVHGGTFVDLERPYTEYL